MTLPADSGSIMNMTRAKYFTTAEAAEKLGLDERRVRQFCEAGRLGVKIGRNWAISEADLKRFAKKPRAVGRPPKKGK